VVEGARLALGCSVAVEPLTDNEAETAAPPLLRRTKLVPVTLAGAIGSLKVADNVVPTLTFVAPAAGVTAETVGAVVSGAAVVNDQVKSEASAFPARSFTPLEPERRVAV
jgi:hypothetical protein